MMLPVKLQGPIRIRTPAKINPYLQVLARRPDGYHDLRLGLVSVSLFDEITFRPGGPGQATPSLEAPREWGDPAKNLVIRAAEAFGKAAGMSVPLSIDLVKRIPAGAGLGGGSGNAAGTLTALNRLAGEPLSRDRLLGLARELGADVPFFLEPVPCRAEGRGDEPCPMENFPVLHLIVVRPPFSISTATAYGAVRPRLRSAPPPAASSREAVVGALENDFEAALFPLYPQLADIKEALVAAGAEGALLCGSGSALFGIFADRVSRDAALPRLQPNSDWRLFACETLAGHEYSELPVTPDDD